MSQCKNFSPLSLGLIVNCPNCLLWSIAFSRCKEEAVVVANHMVGEDDVGWARW